MHVGAHARVWPWHFATCGVTPSVSGWGFLLHDAEMDRPDPLLCSALYCAILSVGRRGPDGDGKVCGTSHVDARCGVVVVALV